MLCCLFSGFTFGMESLPDLGKLKLDHEEITSPTGESSLQSAQLPVSFFEPSYFKLERDPELMSYYPLPSAPLLEELQNAPLSGENPNYQSPLMLTVLEEQKEETPQYIMVPREEFLKMMEMVKENNEMTKQLLEQGDKQVDVLERIEHVQDTMVDSLKESVLRVKEQLVNSEQTTFQKAVNWGSFLFKAGVSGATAVTTYSGLVPVLGYLPAIVALPPVVPVAVSTYVGLRLFTNLV